MSSKQESEIEHDHGVSDNACVGSEIGVDTNKKNINLEDDEKQSRSRSVPFYKLFVFADRFDMVLMICGIVGALANGISYPVLTILFGKFADSFGQTISAHVMVHKVSQVCVQFVYVGFLASIGSFFEIACWTATGERQAASIRSLYLKTILQQEIAFFDKETSTGTVIETLSGDTILIQGAIGDKVGKFIELTTTLLGGFAVSFIQGWKLTLVLLSIVPLFLIAGGLMTVATSKLSRTGQLAYAEAGNIVEQTTSAIRTVASFTGERKSVAEYDKSLMSAYRAVVQQGIATGATLGFTLLVSFCSHGLSVWYGAQLIVNEGYSGGNVITIIFATFAGSRALGDISPCLAAFAAGQGAAYKIFSVIYRKPKINVFDTKGLVLQDIGGDIELREIHFSYPARPDVQIFSGFSLEISKGTTAALVGESGSGKSTVISLLQRFYDPQAGEVLIDGINLKHFQLRWIRQKMGLVSQEPVLFGTTIKENIAYGKDNATLEEIKAASEIANAANFITKMPQGYDTVVGEHGTQLSGGQKQRIAIARAILKDTRILLLDEATSALDTQSERLVQEALERMMMNRTTVVVAHRLSTISNADLIVVVHKGSIVEKGTHSQLVMNPSSTYSHLIRLQEVLAAEGDEPLSDSHELEIHHENIGRVGRQFKSESSRNIISISPSNAGNTNASSASFTSPDQSLSLTENDRLHIPRNQDKSLQHKWWFWRKSKTEGDIEDGESKPAKEGIIFRLASLNIPEAPFLLLGSLAASLTGVTFPISGLLLASIVYTYYEPEDQLRKNAKFWALMFVVSALATFTGASVRLSCFGVAGGRLIKRLRVLVFENIVHQEIGWFDENPSGTISARLATDAANVRSMMGDAISMLMQNLATIVAGILISFTANWQLALLMLGLLPLMILQSWVQLKYSMGFSANAKVMYEEASQIASDAVGSIRTVASFCAEEKVTNLYREKCSVSLKSGFQQGIIGGVGLGFSNFVMFAIHALAFWVGALLVEDGKTTYGKVFRVFFCLTGSAAGISRSIALIPDISKVNVSVNSVFKMLDRKSKIDPSDTSGMILPNVKGDIEFKSVNFKYPTRPEMQIFQKLCLCVNSGQTVALTGESGSGKSTVISLVERFYDPDSGQILLDGVDTRRLQVRWLRQQIGLVSQEPSLFNGTIRRNITYGKDGIVSEEEIKAASEASNAHEFISALPEGYDTQVGERGVQLSGGQKQRIAIARAIIKNPRILLLDEATSALDAESEHIIQEALERIRVNRSTIIVAHRLSTIKNADVIVLLKNGVVMEEGQHEELINRRDGAYAALVKLHMISAL